METVRKKRLYKLQRGPYRALAEGWIQLNPKLERAVARRDIGPTVIVSHDAESERRFAEAMRQGFGRHGEVLDKAILAGAAALSTMQPAGEASEG